MNNKYLNQIKFNEIFLEVCTNGDLGAATQLFETYYLKQQKTYFNSFLEICGLAHPVLRIHHDNREALEKACSSGHKNLIEFFLKQETFIKQANECELLSNCLYSAFTNGQLEIAKLITPAIRKKTGYYYTNIIHGLIGACRNNDFECIKYIFTNKELDFDKYKNFYPGTEIINGENFEDKCVIRAIDSNRTDILYYFAFELSDIHQKAFLIALENNHVNLSNLQNIQTHKELENEIDLDDNNKNKPKKKLKL